MGDTWGGGCDTQWPSLPRGGAISHSTAASRWGLPLLLEPTRPDLTIPPNAPRCPAGWQPHWATLSSDELFRWPDGTLSTSALRTVCDCARTLPLYPAVALIDAALRRRLITRQDLIAAVRASRGPGIAALRRAVRLSDGRADSPQESVGRVALTLAGMLVIPQYTLAAGPLTSAYDLGLEWARVVVDLQSRAHHSDWPAVRRDIRRHNEVNLERGWKLAWTTPDQVWPNPRPFVLHVIGVVATQPGPRSARWRRTYVDEAGKVSLPARLEAARNLGGSADL